MGRLGLERDGAMTDYVLVPEETLHAVPDGVSSAEAAVTEPAAVALGAVRRANLSPGDTVLVIGSGTIGLIIVKLCQLMGAGRVLLAGLPSDRERWPVAQIMGADEFIEVNGDNAGQAIREAAGKSGIAVAFDASGAPSVPALAVEAVNPGGEVMLVGIYPKRVTIEVTNNVVRQIKTIKGSYGGHTLDWGRVLRLMASRKLDISPLISMSLPVRRAAEGFEAVIAQKALKVLLKPGRD
jgi:threonine dehydrogenase-like Zn-dependent dehydrogenase